MSYFHRTDSVEHTDWRGGVDRDDLVGDIMVSDRMRPECEELQA